ncbi:type 2 lanthipeptide synthetase LanM family protein [Streptomyces phyllanthi]|uniref:Type 2 lantipeptide synthetase LanM n=1 Tax=Streptomyces phyllanthi TaxID=1803180 RepID=A0A5N8W9W9_9ACTN|nr:type 2 lanthipeptide synthetase LanM family protein [Streptomyces phyllanthi]MPY43134.1 type 2 lantipeptide synthetase LanM [Streptomyces phyllanthi]
MLLTDWGMYFPEIHTSGELADLVESTWGHRIDANLPRTDDYFLDEPSAELSRILADIGSTAPLACFPAGFVAGTLNDIVRIVSATTLFAQNDRTAGKVLMPLLVSLGDLSMRAVIIDLHTASRRGELAGETPEARYADFLGRMATAEYRRSFAERYPLLLADVRRVATNHATALRRLFDAAEADWDGLTRTFPMLAEAGPLVRLDFGQGDRHRDGASVAVLGFESGYQLVFKPRSLLIDQRFGMLLGRLNRELGLRLRAPRVLCSGRHGWMEHLSYDRLGEPAEQVEYYRRIGHHAALLHLLNGWDIHYENLVCHQGSPVLIDLETLLRPVLPEDGRQSAMRLVERALDRSVSSTGILPMLVMGAGGAGVDVGGMGFGAGQTGPFKRLTLNNPGRDDMYLSYEQPVLRASELVPDASDYAGNATEVLDAVTEGFRLVCEWVLAHRAEFRELVQRLFARVEIRHLHNPTYFYAQLLEMTTHPDLLRDETARNMVLCRVGLGRGGGPQQITRGEHRDLSRGEVPYFSARSDSRELFDSTGASLGRLLAQTPLESVLDKLDSLSAGVIDEQCKLIATTFLNKLPPEAGFTGFTIGGSLPTPTGSAERLAKAVELGDGLLATMVEASGGSRLPTWCAPLFTAVNPTLWTPGALGYDLYCGVSGVGLFLAHLGGISGKSRFSDAARKIFEPIAEQIAARTFPVAELPTGAFTGTAGILYGLAHAGLVLDDKAITGAALDGTALLRAELHRNPAVDVIDGMAGVLAIALALHRIDGDPRALELAVAAYEGLKNRYPGLDPDRLSSGFAHGVAGIYPYLADLATVLPDRESELRADVAALFDKQFTMLDESGTDWYTSPDRQRMSYTWCHGSPGILLGLSLLIRSGAPVPARTENQFGIALSRTIENGFGRTLTYCHGDMGNLEILGFACRVSGDPALERELNQAHDRFLDCYTATQENNRYSKYTYSNSLMAGTTSVGYGLLRSLDPDRVPAVLWLDR